MDHAHHHHSLIGARIAISPHEASQTSCVEPRSTSTPELRERFLAVVPSLRAFAMSLTGNIRTADDLVQETLLRAIGRLALFDPKMNLRTWLLKILHDAFQAHSRKRSLKFERMDGRRADGLTSD